MVAFSASRDRGNCDATIRPKARCDRSRLIPGGTPRAGGATVTLHEIRQRHQDYHLRVTRFTQPLLSRRGAARAAWEVSRAVDRLTEHYRIAMFARAEADLRTHLGLAIEAIDESVFWLELLRLTADPPTHDLDSLITEGQELAAMLSSVDAKPRRANGSDRTVIV
jgi:hypothetical protein